MSKENVHLLKVKLEGRVLKSKMENELQVEVLDRKLFM